MHFRITFDIDAESGLDPIVFAISGPARKHFISKDYGNGLQGIVIVLTCRDPERNFEQRIKFSKKDKILYTDIMLNLLEMRAFTDQERFRTVVYSIVSELPGIIEKQKINSFDGPRFCADFKEWIDQEGVKKVFSCLKGENQ